MRKTGLIVAVLAPLMMMVPFSLAGGEAAAGATSTPPAVAVTVPAAGTTEAPQVVVTLPDRKTLPASPGYFRLKADVTVGKDRFPVAFALFLPATYFSTKQPMPVVVSLHNKGMEGAHGGALDCEGFTSLWVKDAWDTRDPNTKPVETSLKIRSVGQFIGLAPQTPHGMHFFKGEMPRVLASLIEALRGVYQMDAERIYLTGFSYGGTQTWLIAEQLPDLFAAIVPVSGRATADPAKTAQTLSRVPVYIGAGGVDPFFLANSKQMYEVLNAAGHSRCVLNVVKNGNHFSYCSIYTDPEFWNWLLAQRRSERPATRPVTPTTSPSR